MGLARMQVPDGLCRLYLLQGRGGVRGGEEGVKGRSVKGRKDGEGETMRSGGEGERGEERREG